MMTRFPTGRLLAAWSVVTALWLIASSPVSAQTPVVPPAPTVPAIPSVPATQGVPASNGTATDTAALTAKHVKFTVKQKSMSEMMALLCEQLGCSIVADDTPLKKLADVDVEGTGKEALDRVAETFDYDWTLNRRGIVVMRKVFHDPQDAPQTNAPEMRKMAQQAIAALRVFPVDSDPNICQQQGRQLYNLFSPDLKTRLQTSKHLHIHDMTPEQSDLLQRIVRNELFAGALLQWERLLDMLNALPSARLEYIANGSYNGLDYCWFSPQNPEERIGLARWNERRTDKP